MEVREGAEHLAPPTEAEAFLRPPYRLACQAVVVDPEAGVSFSILERRLRIVVPEPEPRTAPVDPAVRVRGGVVHWHEHAVGPRTGGMYGIALDVGTTTVALELVDLDDGRVLEVVALENPQRFGGSDVMNRISYDSGSARGQLRQSLRAAINKELRRLYRRHGVDRREVFEVVVVGNATMRDLFFGLDVASIGHRPYKSTTELELLEGRRSTTALTALAHELGFHANSQARIWGAPLVASHVGADVTADLVATGLADGRGASMLVDVGTNTEVVVAAGGRIVAASCPAGPAFEGGAVMYGMQASAGAIESLAIGDDGRFSYRTIDDARPKGICGSGLIDLVAALRRSGRMTPKGVFAGRAPLVEVVPEAGITFSRSDASELAQAKAANSVGQAIALREAGVTADEVDRLYLAGGFASYVDVENAIEIGFLAPVRPGRVVKVGNASLRGARELLLSVTVREAAERLVRTIEHVELETSPDFFELFVDGCQFKPIAPGAEVRSGTAAA